MLLVIFLIVISIFGIFLLQTTETDAKESLGREMAVTANSILEYMQTKNELYFQELANIMDNAAVRNALKTARMNARSGSDEEWFADGPLVQEILSSPASQTLKQYTDENLVEILVTDVKGDLLAASEKTSDYVQSDEEWWRHTLTEKKHVDGLSYDESAEVSSLSIALRVDDEQGMLGTIKGVVNIEAYKKIYEKIYETYKTQTGARIIIIPEHGNAIILGENKELERGLIKSLNLEKTTSTNYIIDSYEGQQRIYASVSGPLSYSNSVEEATVLVINENVAETEIINNLRQSLAMLMLVSFLCAVFVVYNLHTSTAKPLKKLTRMVRELGAGKHYPRITQGRQDEIAQLEKEIRAMAQKMRKSQKEAMDIGEKQKRKLEREVQKKTAELQDIVEYLKKSRTATYNMMEDLQEANVGLEKKEELKNDFLNMISHELKTPLTPIKANLDLLSSDSLGKTTELQQKSLATLMRNAERLEGIIKNLLEISRIEAGKIILHTEKIKVQDFVKDIVDEFRIACEEHGLKIILKTNTVPNITADQDRIKECLLNYLNNALKFTKKGSITVTIKKKGKQVKFSVTDTGKGINPENMKNLFQKFYQEGKIEVGKSKGVGLGLYSVRKIIELHGGKVGAESSTEGSTFWFTLPTAPKQKR